METATAVANDDKGRRGFGGRSGWNTPRGIYQPLQSATLGRVYDYARRTGGNSHVEVVYSTVAGLVSILGFVAAIILVVVK